MLCAHTAHTHYTKGYVMSTQRMLYVKRCYVHIPHILIAKVVMCTTAHNVYGKVVMCA